MYMQIIQIFRIFNIYLKNISFITIFIIIFYKLFIKFRHIFFHLKPLQVIFEILPTHPNCLNLNIWSMIIQCFLLQFFIYLLFVFAYLYIAWYIPPLIHFSIIINISLSVDNSNFTPVNFKQSCHANPGADKKWAVSSSYISIHLFLNFSNTSISNNVSRWTYWSWYLPTCF